MFMNQRIQGLIRIKRRYVTDAFANKELLL